MSAPDPSADPFGPDSPIDPDVLERERSRPCFLYPPPAQQPAPHAETQLRPPPLSADGSGPHHASDVLDALHQLCADYRQAERELVRASRPTVPARPAKARGQR